MVSVLIIPVNVPDYTGLPAAMNTGLYLFTFLRFQATFRDWGANSRRSGHITYFLSIIFTECGRVIRTFDIGSDMWPGRDLGTSFDELIAR